MLNRTFAALSILSMAAFGCDPDETSRNTSEPTASTSAIVPTDPDATATRDETAQGSDQALVGGYSNASVDDEKIRIAAEFAAAEESKKGIKINLKSISSAETQVVAGANYKLVMVVDAGGTEKTVEVVVYEDLQQSMTVTSWSIR